jgi:poly(3-hydroxybutyrate) depolymerase
MMRNLFAIGPLFSAIALTAGLTMSASANTDANTEQAGSMQNVFFQGEQSPDQKRFSGRLDSISRDGRTVVINDTVLEVSPIITVDGVSISRERLSQKLNEGQKVEFRLSDDSKAGKQLTEILTK